MQQQSNLKSAAYVSLMLFVLLVVGAIYYYAERMFLTDATYIAFNAINEEKIQIQQFRFGAFITQIVPVLGAKMGLSIKSILIAYSASFHLFYLFVAAINLFVFRAYRFVILFAFYWALITTATFFWPNNEVHQGIAYLFLLLPALIYAGEKKYHFAVPVILVAVLGTTALFCHPLVLPAFLFLWVYVIADKTNWHFNKAQTVVLTLLVLAIAAAKMYTSVYHASYDTGKLDGVRNIGAAGIFQAFRSPLAKAIYAHILSNYWILPVISFIGFVHLVLRKKFFLAAWAVGCSLVYFVLLCLTFSDYVDFITESEMMAGIIIATTPFVFVTLTSLRKEIAAGILLLIFTLRLVNFRGENAYFTERVHQLTSLIAKMKNQDLTKVILVKNGGYTDPKWTFDWAFAVESMMLSASILDKPVRQFAVVPEVELPWRVPANNTDLVLSFGNWTIDKINLSYFPFDTTRPYTLIPYDEFLK